MMMGGVSDDKLTWTFRIRENIKFSNGNDMTPELVKNSIERTFELSDRANTFFEYDSIEVDGQNLIIKTKEPTATLAGSLADPLFLIMDSSVDYENINMSGPICTGPYIIESFNPTIDCVVAKNENYWNGEVGLDKVTFNCIADPITRSLALQSGDIDIAYGLKSENLTDFENNENYNIQKLNSLRTSFALMNENGPLADKNLRQAIMRGLDKETYCKILLDDGATTGKAPIPPTLNFGFNELNDENSYDPSSSINILTQAGYIDIDGDGYVETPKGEQLVLDFVLYTSREELKTYSQAAQIDLNKIGININLIPVSYETALEMRNSKDFDLLMWSMVVANTGDPEKYLRENWYSQSTANQTGYKNSEVDKLLEELSLEFDENTRRELIIKIQKRAKEEGDDAKNNDNAKDDNDDA